MLAIGVVDDERRGGVEVWSTRSSDNTNPPPPPASTSPQETTTAKTKSERIRHFTTGASVTTIALSADGKLVAIASGSGAEDDGKPSVEVLDAKTGKTVASPEPTTDEDEAVLAATGRSHFEAKALALSPDGKLVAVGTGGGQVKLFNAPTGELVRSLDDEQERLADKKTPEKFKALRRAMGSVASLAFSHDGSLLATCGRSFDDSPLVRDGPERSREFSTGPGRLKVWEVKTGTLKHDLVGHSHAKAVAFSPEESLLASAGRWLRGSRSGAGVILWNAQSGKKLRTISTEAGGDVHSVAFSSDGKRLAISSLHLDVDEANDAGQGAITVAHVASGVVRWRGTFSGMARPVGFFTAEGMSLHGRQDLRFRDAETGELLASFGPQSPDQGARWNDFVIAKRGHMLAIGGVDHERRGRVEVWDFAGP
jgi:WD40 repeat protein